MDDAEFQELLEEMRGLSKEQAAAFNNPNTLKRVIQDAGMSPEQVAEFIMTKNIAVFGGINEYVADFVTKTRNARLTETQKIGQRAFAQKLLAKEGLDETNRAALEQLLGNQLAVAAAAAGGKRKMSRKYCKKTACRKMGFSQRASCRPYKKCSTRRVKRGRVST